MQSLEQGQESGAGFWGPRALRERVDEVTAVGERGPPNPLM